VDVAQQVDGGPTLGELRERLRRETRKLEAVRELGRVLGATLDLDRLLVVLLEKVCELLDAERATIFLVSDDGRELFSTVAQGGAIAPIRLAVGDGIAGWVAKSGETVNIPDAYADPRFHPEVDQRSGFRTTNILCMPMPDHQGRTIGVVQVLNKRGRPFDADDEAMLATVAVHAGISIENGKLFQSVVDKNRALLVAQAELRQRIRELDLLVEIEEEASRSLDLDELLDRILARAMQLLDAEAGSILLRDRASGDLFFRSARGDGAESLKRMKLPAGAGIVGWVALHKQPLVVADPALDARHDLFVAEKIGVPARSILAVPLVAPSTTPDGDGDAEPALGAFELLNKRTGTFSGEDLKLLTLFAGQAAKAIALARVREERLSSERLATIGQMLSSVLHDLKTPMTIASGYAQLAAQSDDAETRDKYASMIVKQFDLMAAMTREVLLFARGQSNLLVRKQYVNKFAEDVKQQIERELAGRKIELRFEAKYLGIAYFDENKLFRAVHNLTRNAIEAMDEGGVYTVTIDSDGTDLLLTFADTGRGIPDSLRGRLFQAFATAGKAEGTGLGLAIVKKIVDDHGGKITYDTQAGRGTTFRLALPLERPASP
jgi:signal transduction histidine kinase